jgi:hypothetical protein
MAVYCESHTEHENKLSEEKYRVLLLSVSIHTVMGFEGLIVKCVWLVDVSRNTNT